MNVLTGLQPKTILGFKGLWDRGSDQSVPEDHLSICTNCVFPGQNLVGIRESLLALSNAGTLGTGEFVVSAFPYSIIQSGTNTTDFLFLTNMGNIIDGLTNTILGTFTGGFANPDDFSCINLFGRVFISLKAQGIAWENSNALQSSVHYYDGTIFAPIAGVGPMGAPTLSQTATGTVNAGLHSVAYSYLYKYGYVSPPGPTANILSDGTHNILVSGLPTSFPANVIGIVVTMTTANGTELFFVPGAGDVTSGSFDFNAPDTVLIDSADYLNNLLTIVPNGSALKFYHGRMVIVGPHGIENLVLFSTQLIPESFDQVGGVVTLPLDFAAMDPNTGLILNDTFYILKPNGTFSTQDNGGDPATWMVTSIDAGLGGWDTGVSSFGGNYTDILDNCLVCSPRGLIAFTGAYQDTPLSFNIETLWKSINPKLFYLVQIAHDIWNKRVYIAAPQFNNYNNLLLMMDYSEGLSPSTVKWSQWTISHTKITRMFCGVYLITGTGAGNISQQPIFIFGDSSGILTLTTSTTLDEGTTGIPQEIDTGPLSLGSGISMFIMFTLGIVFNQNLELFAFNIDRSVTYTIPGFSNVSSYYAGQELSRFINVTSEKIIIKLANDRTQSASWFTLNRIDLYGKVMWDMRPAITQSH